MNGINFILSKLTCTFEFKRKNKDTQQPYNCHKLFKNKVVSPSSENTKLYLIKNKIIFLSDPKRLVCRLSPHIHSIIQHKRFIS